MQRIIKLILNTHACKYWRINQIQAVDTSDAKTTYTYTYTGSLIFFRKYVRKNKFDCVRTYVEWRVAETLCFCLATQLFVDGLQHKQQHKNKSR